MTKVNRETLKKYFSAGNRPTVSQFTDLVDSVPNIVDDGMARTDKNGLKLSPLNQEGSVIEFYKDIQDNYPVWKITLNSNMSLTVSQHNEKMPALTLYPNGPIKIQTDVEIDGTVAARGFTGNYARNSILSQTAKANGQWNTIPLREDKEKDGCRAYRIMAGCGKCNHGKYALLEATAMHCYGKRKRIKTTQSWFGTHFNRIKLRWYEENGHLQLQIRTRSNYGENAAIRYYITELWNDYYMNQESAQLKDNGSAE